MTNEEALYDTLLEQAQLLESCNMTELMTLRVSAFWEQVKLNQENELNPAAKFIIDRAESYKG